MALSVFDLAVWTRELRHKDHFFQQSVYVSPSAKSRLNQERDCYWRRATPEVNSYVWDTPQRISSPPLGIPVIFKIEFLLFPTNNITHANMPLPALHLMFSLAIFMLRRRGRV